VNSRRESVHNVVPTFWGKKPSGLGDSKVKKKEKKRGKKKSLRRAQACNKKFKLGKKIRSKRKKQHE